MIRCNAKDGDQDRENNAAKAQGGRRKGEELKMRRSTVRQLVNRSAFNGIFEAFQMFVVLPASKFPLTHHAF